MNIRTSLYGGPPLEEEADKKPLGQRLKVTLSFPKASLPSGQGPVRPAAATAGAPAYDPFAPKGQAQSLQDLVDRSYGYRAQGNPLLPDTPKTDPKNPFANLKNISSLVAPPKGTDFFSNSATAVPAIRMPDSQASKQREGSLPWAMRRVDQTLTIKDEGARDLLHSWLHTRLEYEGRRIGPITPLSQVPAYSLPSGLLDKTIATLQRGGEPASKLIDEMAEEVYQFRQNRWIQGMKTRLGSAMAPLGQGGLDPDDNPSGFKKFVDQMTDEAMRGYDQYRFGGGTVQNDPARQKYKIAARRFIERDQAQRRSVELAPYARERGTNPLNAGRQFQKTSLTLTESGLGKGGFEDQIPNVEEVFEQMHGYSVREFLGKYRYSGGAGGRVALTGGGKRDVDTVSFLNDLAMLGLKMPTMPLASEEEMAIYQASDMGKSPLPLSAAAMSESGVTGEGRAALGAAGATSDDLFSAPTKTPTFEQFVSRQREEKTEIQRGLYRSTFDQAEALLTVGKTTKFQKAYILDNPGVADADEGAFDTYIRSVEGVINPFTTLRQAQGRAYETLTVAERVTETAGNMLLQLATSARLAKVFTGAKSVAELNAVRTQLTVAAKARAALKFVPEWIATDAIFDVPDFAQSVQDQKSLMGGATVFMESLISQFNPAVLFDAKRTPEEKTATAITLGFLVAAGAVNHAQIVKAGRVKVGKFDADAVRGQGGWEMFPEELRKEGIGFKRELELQARKLMGEAWDSDLFEGDLDKMTDDVALLTTYGAWIGQSKETNAAVKAMQAVEVPDNQFERIPQFVQLQEKIFGADPMESHIRAGRVLPSEILPQMAPGLRMRVLDVVQAQEGRVLVTVAAEDASGNVVRAFSAAGKTPLQATQIALLRSGALDVLSGKESQIWASPKKQSPLVDGVTQEVQVTQPKTKGGVFNVAVTLKGADGSETMSGDGFTEAAATADAMAKLRGVYGSRFFNPVEDTQFEDEAALDQDAFQQDPEEERGPSPWVDKSKKITEGASVGLKVQGLEPLRPVVWVRPENIGVKKGIQYKSGITDEDSQTTAEYADVKRFNPEEAGILELWRDKDGNLFVMHGHHRRGMALNADEWVVDSIGEDGKVGTEVVPPENRMVAARVFDENEGYTIEWARLHAALSNLRAGSGTALDAAKVMREMGMTDPSALVPYGISMASRDSSSRMTQLARDAIALASLPDTALEAVANRMISESAAAGVASAPMLETPEAREAAMRRAIEAKHVPATYSQGYIFGQNYALSKIAAVQLDLFGDQTEIDTLDEQSDIDERARKILSVQMTNLGRGAKAEALEGEVIDAEKRRALIAALGKTQKDRGKLIDWVMTRFDDVVELKMNLAAEVARGNTNAKEAASKLAVYVREAILGSNAKQLTLGRDRLKQTKEPDAARGDELDTRAGKPGAGPQPGPVRGAEAAAAQAPIGRLDVPPSTANLLRFIGDPRQWPFLAKLSVSDSAFEGLTAQDVADLDQFVAEKLGDPDLTDGAKDLLRDLRRLADDAQKGKTDEKPKQDRTEGNDEGGGSEVDEDGDAAPKADEGSQPDGEGDRTQESQITGGEGRSVSHVLLADGPARRTVVETPERRTVTVQTALGDGRTVRVHEDVTFKVATEIDGLPFDKDEVASRTYTVDDDNLNTAIRLANSLHEARGQYGALNTLREPSRQPSGEVKVENGQMSFEYTYGNKVMELSLPVREGTTEAQARLAQAALVEFEQAHKSSIFAKMIVKETAQKGGYTLLGKPVTSIDDVAMYSQVLRDPRFETSRIVMVKDGRIVGVQSYSQRMPGMTSMPFDSLQTAKDWIFSLKQETGFHEFYIVHNHPSADPTPSEADVGLTKGISMASADFRGHVVIDSDSYAVINRRGEVLSKKLSPSHRTFVEQGYGALYDKSVRRTEDVTALLGAVPHDVPIVFILDSRNKVKYALSVPREFLTTNVAGLRELLRLASPDQGGRDVLIAAPDALIREAVPNRELRKLFEHGIVLNIVASDADTTAQDYLTKHQEYIIGLGRAMQHGDSGLTLKEVNQLPIVARSFVLKDGVIVDEDFVVGSGKVSEMARTVYALDGTMMQENKARFDNVEGRWLVARSLQKFQDDAAAANGGVRLGPGFWAFPNTAEGRSVIKQGAFALDLAATRQYNQIDARTNALSKPIDGGLFVDDSVPGTAQPDAQEDLFGDTLKEDKAPFGEDDGRTDLTDGGATGAPEAGIPGRNPVGDDADNGGSTAKRPTGGGGDAVGGRPGLRVVDGDLIPIFKNFVRPDSTEFTAGSLDADQLTSVNLALTRFARGERGFLLADGTGVGKTRQELAILAMRLKASGKRVAIVTKSKTILKDAFAGDAKAMGVDLNDKRIVMGTYDDLSRGTGVFNGEFDLVIFDEAHELSNFNSKRARAARALKTDHVLWATATPFDRPSSSAYFLGELLDMDVNAAGKRLGFSIELTDQSGPDGEPLFQVVPLPGKTWSQIIEEIQKVRREAVAAGALIRREYPFYGEIKTHGIMLDDAANGEYDNIMRAYDEELEWAGKKLFYAKQKHDKEKTRETALEVEKWKRRLVQIHMNRTGETSRWLEQHKLTATVEMIDAALSAGRKVIVAVEFVASKGLIANHVNGMAFPKSETRVPSIRTRLIPVLEASGIKYAEVHGEAKGDNIDAVRKFQEGDADVLVMTGASGGTGINLDDTVGDKPRTLIVTTANFKGDQVQQLIGRVSRRNTKSPSEAVFLQAPTILSDQRRAEALNMKLAALQGIQGSEDIDTAFLTRTGERELITSGSDSARKAKQTVIDDSLKQNLGGSMDVIAYKTKAGKEFWVVKGPQAELVKAFEARRDLFFPMTAVGDGSWWAFSPDKRALVEEYLAGTTVNLRESGPDQFVGDVTFHAVGDVMDHVANTLLRPVIDPIVGRDPRRAGEIILDLDRVFGKTKVNARFSRSRRGGGKYVVTYGAYASNSQMKFLNYKWNANLDTVAHELGHQLDDTYRLTGQAKVNGQPVAIGKWAYDNELLIPAFQYSAFGLPLDGMRKEGVAEFIRAWLVNPAMARALAPEFARFFEDAIPEGQLQHMRSFGDEIRVLEGAEAYKHVASGTTVKTPVKMRESFGEWIAGRLKAAGSFFDQSKRRNTSGGWQSTRFDRARALWLDDYGAPFEAAWLETASRTGYTDPGGTAATPQGLSMLDNPMTWYRWLPYTDQVTSVGLMHGLMDLTTGETVTRPLGDMVRILEADSAQSLNDQWEELLSYMLAQRHIEKLAVFRSKLLNKLRTETLPKLQAEAAKRLSKALDRILLSENKRAEGKIEEAKRNIADKKEFRARRDEIRKGRDANVTRRKHEAEKAARAWLAGKIADAKASMDLEVRAKQDNLVIPKVTERKPLRLAHEVVAAVAADPAKQDRYNRASQVYRQIGDWVIDQLQKSGKLSAKDVALIRDSNQFWIDTHRVREGDVAEWANIGDDQDPAEFVKAAAGLTEPDQITQYFKGSAAAIQDPVKSLISLVHRTHQEVMRNNSLRTWTALLSQYRSMHDQGVVDGDLAVRIDNADKTPAKASEQTLEVWRAGNKEIWHVPDPLLFEVLSVPNKVGRGGWLWEAVAFGPTRIARAMIVNHPKFAARNFLRDSQHRWMLSNFSNRPGETMRWFDKFDWEVYDKYGVGLGRSEVFEDAHTWEQVQEQLFEKAVPTEFLPGGWAKAKKGLHQLASGYERALTAAEKANRIIEFKRARQFAVRHMGLGDHDANLYAAYHARETMVDFRRASRMSKRMNKFWLFYNASMQGVATTLRAFKNDPASVGKRKLARTLFRALMYTAIVGSAERKWNDEMGATDEYRDINPMMRDLFWCFKAGPNHWLYFPKPHELGLISSLVTRLADRQMGDKNALGWDFASRALQVMVPFSFDGMFGGYQSIAESALFNKSLFFDRYIVSPFEKEKDLDEREQKGASDLGKYIGNKVLSGFGLWPGVDGRIIDHLARGSFGYWGQGATDFSKAVSGDIRWDRFLYQQTGFSYESPSSSSRDVQWVYQNLAGRNVVDSSFHGAAERYWQVRNDPLASQQQIDAAAEAWRREASLYRRTIEPILKNSAVTGKGRSEMVREEVKALSFGQDLKKDVAPED